MLPARAAMASSSSSCSSPMMSPCLSSSRPRSAILIAGAAAVALLGTAFPILFSRKDLYALPFLDHNSLTPPFVKGGVFPDGRCPECDGAGFIRQSAATLRANAARKDQAQIVCPRCNGLGKLNQIDK